jgi:hypothetical protein
MAVRTVTVFDGSVVRAFGSAGNLNQYMTLTS